MILPGELYLDRATQRTLMVKRVRCLTCGTIEGAHLDLTMHAGIAVPRLFCPACGREAVVTVQDAGPALPAPLRPLDPAVRQ